MKRLLVHVEGQTEETFVNKVLAPYLYTHGFSRVAARKVGNPRLVQRGGVQSWDSVRRDILRHLKDDTAAFGTTMFDFYGLPKSWPGRTQTASLGPQQCAAEVETAILADVERALGSATGPARFVPYIVMHEFEGLLFSDCDALAEAVDRSLVAELRGIRDAFPTPEHINDSIETAPSKRLAKLKRGYQKVLAGERAMSRMGLEIVIQECPGFARWIQRLKQL
ncbi:MAG: DUF4276 family protein [Myxococcota bacterium]